MSTYSIKDLEHLSGIKAHTLRIWEQRYNFIEPKRTDTNIRYYNDEDLKLVLNVSLLKDNGFKISKISQMSLDEMHQEVIRLTEKNLRYQDQIHAMVLTMVDLDEDRFEKIVATNILQLGFEKTMINIIYPFLSKIGILWQTGAVNPAQEHFISNLVRQKLIVAIDGQYISNTDGAKKYLLFLPAGELHELSLLFSNYLIRSRGGKVIYLGQNLPFEDLEHVCKIHRPDYLLSIITTSPGQDQVQQYVNRLGDSFPESHVLLSGFQVIGQDLETRENVTIFNKIEDLVEFVEDQNTELA